MSFDNGLSDFVERKTLAGAVTLVADGERVLSLEAVGFADIAANKPMTPDALFWIASQTKPITSTAVMMLVDEGKLGLDDAIEDYLPEFSRQWLTVESDDAHVLLAKPKSKITLRQCLSHTAGLSFGSLMEKPTLDGLPLRLAVRSYAMTSLLTEPGTQYQYSNAGINIAGCLIELVAGMPYEAFLQTRIFDPLGMNDTTFFPDAAKVACLATAYKPNAEKDGLEPTTISQLTYPLDNSPRFPMPGGGLFSTAGDVAKFCQLILGGGVWNGERFVSEEAIREMTRQQTSEQTGGSYGLGWSTDGKTFGHGGAFATGMTIDPTLNRIFVYLVQHDGFPGDGANGWSVFLERANLKFR